MSQIERINNLISVRGDLRDFHFLLAQLHQCIEDACFPDLTIDLAECTSAFQNSMLSVCAQVLAYRHSGIEIEIVPPKDKKLYNLFKNTNWGHYLDPRKFDPSNFRGYTRVPATQYITPDQQQAAVNRIVNVILGALPDLERSNLSSFEWAVNEITDNVLLHSESPVGGLVQVSTFQKNRNSVQFVVADSGVGIPNTLRAGRPAITSDTEALDEAIKEGVTRDTQVGQGNGLFGTYRICTKSNGYFQVDSGHARLEAAPQKGLSITRKNIPYSGTLVVASIDFSDPKLLRDVLRFGGKTYHPVDYIETHYERCEDGPIEFKVSDECKAFGSRVSGQPLRQKIANIVYLSDAAKIIIDFDGVPLVSSSFADEVFGKLFMQLGPVQFNQRISLVNMVDTVEWLVNKAIAQRMQSG